MQCFRHMNDKGGIGQNSEISTERMLAIKFAQKFVS